MKYGLTVDQSVLFGDLSFIGNKRKYFRKSLEIDYELPECLIRDGEMYWNYDDDVEYNRKLLANKPFNEAIEYFINKLSQVVNRLEKTTEAIRKERKWELNSKPVIFAVFREYTEAYMSNMPFLYTFWNTEKLLLGQVKLDFERVFGKEAADEVLNLVLVPAHETYFAKELESFEKILIKIHENKKIRHIFGQANTETIAKKLAGRDFKRLLVGHIDKFAFTSFVTHIGKPMTMEVLIARIKSEQDIDVKRRLLDKEEGNIKDRKKTRKVMSELKSFPEIRKRAILAQELMFWRNQRLDVMWQSDYLIRPLLNKMAEVMGLTYKELVYLRYEEIVG